MFVLDFGLISQIMVRHGLKLSFQRGGKDMLGVVNRVYLNVYKTRVDKGRLLIGILSIIQRDKMLRNLRY